MAIHDISDAELDRFYSDLKRTMSLAAIESDIALLQIQLDLLRLLRQDVRDDSRLTLCHCGHRWPCLEHA